MFIKWLVKEYTESETTDLNIEVIDPCKGIKPKSVAILSLV